MLIVFEITIIQESQRIAQDDLKLPSYNNIIHFSDEETCILLSFPKYCDFSQMFELNMHVKCKH